MDTSWFLYILLVAGVDVMMDNMIVKSYKKCEVLGVCNVRVEVGIRMGNEGLFESVESNDSTGCVVEAVW